jgi:hypothetical protein
MPLGPGVALIAATVAIGTAGYFLWPRRRHAAAPRREREERWPRWLSGDGTAGGLPVMQGEDAPITDSEMIDFGDEAQRQMPGEPPNLTIHPRAGLEEARRREFDRIVDESRG